MHAMARAEVEQLAWADPARGAIDYTKMPEIELAGIVRGREAFTLFGWKPYMHNPKLKRWLHRIDMPTLLLWGERDRIITPVIGEQWRNAVAGARSRPSPTPATSRSGNSRRFSPIASPRSRAHRPGRTPCASGTSPRWPTTRRGTRA